MESSQEESHLMYTALQQLCVNNQEYFKKDDDEHSQRLYLGFCALLDHVKAIVSILDEFHNIAHKYDYDENTFANGYRGFIQISDRFVVVSVKVCKEICINRGSLFFKKSRYVKDIEVSGQIFASLISCFNVLRFLRSSNNSSDNLFLQSGEKVKELLGYIDKVNLYCFFGRFIGFQYCESIQPIVKSLSMMMAAFGAVYFGENDSFLTWTNSCRAMIMDPEARANQIVKISSYRTASVHFCKSFWNLSELELFKIVPNFFHSNSVNKLFTITFEPIQCTNLDGSIVDVPIPTSYTDNDQKSISVRLISAKRRQGMELENNKESLEKSSNGLIFHCHGGGFVAQTSGSHLSYLREWSAWIDVPIISIDYSLAPEAPFPRALEEVLYTYAWVLNNASTLGTTAEKIIFAGDSAGANLCLSLVLKCISMNIRIPDGMFLAYVPVIMSITATPARMLCLLDPLMPFGFMISCIKAYTYSMAKKKARANDKTNENSIRPLHCTNPGNQSKQESAILEEIESFSLPSLNDNEVSKTIENATEEEEKVLFEMTDVSDDTTLPVKFRKATENFIKTINKRMTRLTGAGNIIMRTENSLTNKDYNTKTVEELIDAIPEDIYLSPYLASDDILKQMPPTSILSLTLDPCLDDCIMMAKKFRNCNIKVHLDVLDGLPHGFLNLSSICKEAQDGSKLCAQRIHELFASES